MRFAERVARKRAERKMTQAELAYAVGLSRTGITHIENGNQRIFLHQAGRIAKILGFSLDELMDEE